MVVRLKCVFVPLALLLLLGCKVEKPSPKTEYQPILMTRDVLESAVRWTPARPVVAADKVLQQPPYLFLMELHKGIQVYNNSNPAAPVAIGFIPVPGCLNMAIHNQLLVVDNAVDVVVLNVAAAPNEPLVKSRERNLLPELPPPDLLDLPEEFQKENRPEQTLIIRWEKREDGA